MEYLKSLVESSASQALFNCLMEFVSRQEAYWVVLLFSGGWRPGGECFGIAALRPCVDFEQAGGVAVLRSAADSDRPG